MRTIATRWRGCRGTSLAELMTAVSIGVTATAVAVPMWLSGLDDYRAAGAARYFAARLALARMEAVKRTRTVAVRFESHPEGYRFRVYVDGNRNGVRNADIADGTDWPLAADQGLSDSFSGVGFGIGAHIPGVDGDAGAGDDPIRFGRSNLLSYAATGTASSGTAYIRGRRGAQYAVRVLGATGRTRLLQYRAADRQWVER